MVEANIASFFPIFWVLLTSEVSYLWYVMLQAHNIVERLYSHSIIINYEKVKVETKLKMINSQVSVVNVGNMSNYNWRDSIERDSTVQLVAVTCGLRYRLWHIT